MNLKANAQLFTTVSETRTAGILLSNEHFLYASFTSDDRNACFICIGPIDLLEARR